MLGFPLLSRDLSILIEDLSPPSLSFTKTSYTGIYSPIPFFHKKKMKKKMTVSFPPSLSFTKGSYTKIYSPIPFFYPKKMKKKKMTVSSPPSLSFTKGSYTEIYSPSPRELERLEWRIYPLHPFLSSRLATPKFIPPSLSFTKKKMKKR